MYLQGRGNYMSWLNGLSLSSLREEPGVSGFSRGATSADMLPLLLVILVSVSKGQVYLPPPPGHAFALPSNHKTVDINDSPGNQQPTKHEPTDILLDDPYATMEIFKQKVPNNHKPVHVPVQVISKPEVHVQSSESQVQVQESPVQDLGALDYFTQLGGNPPAAVEEVDDYSTIFPKQTSTVQDSSGHGSAFSSSLHGTGDEYPVSSALQGSLGDDYSSVFPRKGLGIVQSRQTRYYPLQQNNFTPLSDFGAIPSFDNSNLKKLEEIVDETVIPKSLKSKKKYSSKLKKFPKKYRSSSLKKLNNKKLNPDSEFIDDFSIDTMKNKRKIPLRFSSPTAELTSPSFSAGSNEFPNSEETHNDYTAGSGFSSSPSSGFTAGSHAGFSGATASFSAPSGGSEGERMQYQMFNMDGPHSYKFGYDTGKGHNRHFRFEERDSNGRVKGHYGFYDQEGKMSMIHYEADPHTGYRAGPYHHPENHHDFDYNHQRGDQYKK